MAKSVSFWEYLEENEIRIPILQRDYAQGRRGKEQLRKRFLGRIKEALDDPKCNRNLVLDFVYGTVEKSFSKAVKQCFWPIDGQQRLTTMWLLYWYVAFRSNIKKKDCSRLDHFSYMTRLASDKFFHKILILLDCEDCDHVNVDVKKLIRGQTWYSPAWDADPTIDSAMRMLGGGDNELDDGMAKVFKREEFCGNNDKKYWTRLTQRESPAVSFYLVELDKNEISDPDDLYIKLNDRGLSLDGFENFKADLVGHIRSGEQEGGEYEQCVWPVGDKLLNMSLAVASMADNCWTDVFWGLCGDSYSEYLFAFINRFLMCRRIGLGSRITKDDMSFKEYVKYRNNPCDDIRYEGFDPYRTIRSEDISALLNLMSFCHKAFRMRKINELDALMVAPWAEGCGALFIPRDLDQDQKDGQVCQSVQLSTFNESAVFAAIVKAVEKKLFVGESDEFVGENVRKLIRVVWNISENCIDSAEAFIAVVRMLNTMIDRTCDSHSGDIIEYLKSISDAKDIEELCGHGGGVERRRSQLNEEIQKATLWGSHSAAILKAESRRYFKGRIDYLLNGVRMLNEGNPVKAYTIQDALDTADLDFLKIDGLKKWMDRVVFQWQERHGNNASDFALTCEGLFRKDRSKEGDVLVVVHADALKQQICRKSMQEYHLMASYLVRHEVVVGQSSILDRTRNLDADWQMRYHHISYYYKSGGIHLCWYAPNNPWEFRESIRVDDTVRWWYNLPVFCKSNKQKQSGGNWIRVEATIDGVVRFYSFDQDGEKRKIQIEKKNYGGEWGPECVWDENDRPIEDVLRKLHNATPLES